MTSIADIERARDYLADRLSVAERQAFEAQLGRTPELVSELELLLRLREGLARLSERDGAESLIQGRQPRQWRWIAGAIAATVAGLAVSWWAWESRPVPALDASLARYAGASHGTAIVAAHFTFRAMRGPERAPLLDLPATGVIELQVAPSNADSRAHYAFALERIGGDGSRRPVGRLSGLHVDEQGLVHCFAAASRLAPGRYEIELVSDRQPGAAPETFGFALQARDSAQGR